MAQENIYLRKLQQQCAEWISRQERRQGGQLGGYWSVQSRDIRICSKALSVRTERSRRVQEFLRRETLQTWPWSPSSASWPAAIFAAVYAAVVTAVVDAAGPGCQCQRRISTCTLRILKSRSRPIWKKMWTFQLFSSLQMQMRKHS